MRRTGGVKKGGGGGILGAAGADLWVPGAPAVEPEAPEPERSGSPALIEVVVRDRFGLSGIEGGRLVEVVGEGFLGGLVLFRPVGPQAEFGLGWSSGGMKGRGRGGLTDVGEDMSNWLGIRQERDERERFLAGGADQREDFIDPGQEGGPPGGLGRVGIRCLPVRPLWLGRRDLGGGRGETIEIGDLSG